jgi:NDP-sugar pyrophosphorylase family protein
MPDAVLLCGGAGLRLRSVIGNTPKGMANVRGRPFLELLLRQLRRHGFDRAILAIGYGGDAIRSYFGEQAFGLQLAYSVESCPLGTGGALRNAAGVIGSEDVLIMNGDSYTDADLGELVANHYSAKADASVVVVPADGRGDCGSVQFDGSRNLASFEEKQGPFYAPHANAGIYILSKEMLYEIPTNVEISLERKLLPEWLRRGKCIKAFIAIAKCIDIGTPERYWRAQDILANVEVGANVSQCGSQ